MEFQQTSPVDSSVSVPALEISEDLSASTVWDWGNLLDFALETEDTLSLPWDAADLPRLPLSEVETPADPPPVIAPVAGSSNRVRKRDPRLVCANYLAGRVPCACPEVDEKELEGDEEEEQVFGGRKRARAGVVNVGVRCQVPGCEADIKELKGYHRRHRVCLRCANASSVMLDGEEKRYCQQCGKFHVLLDFDEGKRSCRRKLEKHNRRRRRKPADSNNVVEKENLSQAELQENVFRDSDQIQGTPEAYACKAVDNGESNNLVDGEMFLDCENGNGFPGCSFTGVEQAQTKSPLLFAASAEARVDDRKDHPQSAFSSTSCDKKASYSSMCPTGRISFKLYDWNPAEFPRRLRLQIFQWLASMPVELEGYIRPGCTILTVFIAMPQHMWEKLSKDGALYVKHLVNSSESLLSGRGNILIYLSSMIVHVLKDGTSHIKMEVNAPRLHYVHPTYFEAGKAVEFFACGSNLDQPKLRFLVSFAGKYLACDAYRVISNEKLRYYGVNSLVSSSNCEYEVFRINIKQTTPDIFGPAFIEVENESGISNFIPILIGDEQVCSELNKMQGALTFYPNVHEHNSISNAVLANAAISEINVTISDLLVDIAWLLREPCKDYNESLLGSLNVQRLKYILQFSMQNELITVLKAILKYVGIMIHEAGFQNSENLTVSADFDELLEFMKTAKEFLDQRIQHKERSKLDHRHSNFMETVPINLVKNTMVIMPPTNLFEDGRRNSHALVATATVHSVDSDENTSPAPKDISCSKISFLRLNSCLASNHWAINMFSTPISRRWPALFVMGSFLMCFVFCMILLGPHKATDFAVFMGRCSLPSSNL
ncbi:squamosa promoter-binding-like protein 9 [Phalaenopsis equestris]|uniref:squamosa promoter-binding-like protein 9 n=1 Tax=Phalaenopsis equestris TaxID=78828 RepID=UPI0009E48D54|nr:squamosa promoter-binding-like protein 9 [Phalaenopsis equestris]